MQRNNAFRNKSPGEGARAASFEDSLYFCRFLSAAGKKQCIVFRVFLYEKIFLYAEKEIFRAKDPEKPLRFFSDPCASVRKGATLKKSPTVKYNIQNEGEGACLECGTVFYGRKDKHFCNASCKNKWHNRLLRERRKYRMETVSVLARNYEILEGLLKEGRQSAGLAELSELGFEPDYVTGHRKGRCRHDEYSCFDLCYYRSATRIFNLRRKAPAGR